MATGRNVIDLDLLTYSERHRWLNCTCYADGHETGCYLRVIGKPKLTPLEDLVRRVLIRKIEPGGAAERP